MEETRKALLGNTLATGNLKWLFPPKPAPTTHTWEDYKNWVANKAKEKKFYWYRGQADATWTLKTTFHREADKTGMKMADYLTLVEGEVHYQLCSRLNERIRIEDQFEYASYLALLRNHGFPTPILDWTLSPYVGAYFAFRECNSEPDCKRVRIFVFDCDLWTKTYKQPTDLRDPNMYVSVIRPYAKYNPRQLAQNTVYTVTNVTDVGEYMVMLKQRESFLYYFDFPSTIKKDIMRELDLMGINEMTLFPDIDGLCREMKQKYFFRE